MTEFKTPRSHFLQTPGGRLHVQEVGSPKGIPFFVLHYGGGGFGSTLPDPHWLDFAFPRGSATASPRDSATAFRLLFVDRMGYGLSDSHPNGFPLDFFRQERDNLLSLHDQLCAGQPAILAGSSDGGTIALKFAAAYPDRCRALLVDGAHAYVEPSMKLALDDMKRRFLRKFSENHERGEAKHVSTARDWFRVWYALGEKKWSILESLKTITAPLCVLQGDEDGVVPDAHAQAIAEATSGPATWEILLKTGHLCPVESPDLYFAHLQAFLADLQ